MIEFVKRFWKLFVFCWFFITVLALISDANKSAIKHFSSIDSDTLFIELVLVNDRKVFEFNNNDTSSVVQWNQQIVAEVNSLYRKLNIMVILVDVIVWTGNDEINMTTDSDVLLAEFAKYKQKLSTKLKHDVAFLITDTNFKTFVDGKTLKSTICDKHYSAGIVRYMNNIPNAMAILAHELGHSFGMNHDDIECNCSSQGNCVMKAAIRNATNWSDCSVNYIEETRTKLSHLCLINKPEFGVNSFCGNGLLEEGEECDCDQMPCRNCCNQNCTLKDGAECATGTCCDLNTCKVTQAGKVCRKATNECDLIEYCNGTDEFCPSDKYLSNGYPCTDSHCYDGKCNPISKQCKQLLGSEAMPGGDICYSVNSRATKIGNCGFNHKINEYIACNHTDRKCGLLHCTNVKVDEDAIAGTFLSTTRYLNHTCYSTGFGTAHENPSLVANGNICDENKICVNQQCVPTKDVLKCNCSDDHICDNTGQCVSVNQTQIKVNRQQ